MIVIFSTTMFMSITFIFLSHPLSMGVVLLSQTIMIALITGMTSINFWFSYILFLIMVGGMLVLFIYMTSIASNEKFQFSNLLAFLFLLMTLLSMVSYFFNDNSLLTMMNFSSPFSDDYEFNLNLSKFLNHPSNIVLFLMIIYLFFTLIAVVKITNISFGPLRQKF